MADARTAPRKHYFAEVDVIRPGQAKPLKLWGENLSEQGIFLQTNQPWTVGERLALRFPVAEDKVVVRTAEVAWIRPFEPINVDGSMPGMGVRFIAVDPPYRAAIRSLVHTHGSDGPRDGLLPSPHDALLPLSLPPIDDEDGEHTLRGWQFRKLPRSTLPPVETVGANDDHDDDGSAPAALDDARAADSDRWSLGALPSPEASRAPAAVDTSAPAFATAPPRASASLAALAVDDRIDDDTAKAHVGPRPIPDAPGSDDADGAAWEDGAPSPVDDDVTTPLRHRRDADTVADAVRFRLVLDDHDPDAGADSFIPRRAPRRPLRAVAAVALVAMGASLGVVAGLSTTAPRRSSTATTAAATTDETPAPRAPRGVDEAERELRALLDDDGAAEASAAAAPAPSSATPATVAAASPTPTPSAPPSTDARDPTLLPRRPSAEPVLASAVAPPPSSSGPTLAIERGRVVVPLTGGQVKNAFALTGPSRVVVDLAGANLKAFQEIPVAEKGVAKIRFGRPTPDTVRVVVELDTDRAPRDVTTLKHKDSLAVAWK